MSNCRKEADSYFSKSSAKVRKIVHSSYFFVFSPFLFNFAYEIEKKLDSATTIAPLFFAKLRRRRN